MAAIVTDQFRILNAENFVNSVTDTSNSYYIFVGLANPTASGFGKSSTWDTDTPSPIDNFEYQGFASDNMSFGRKITSSNIRRVVRRINWTQGTRYEMYRHDYSINSLSPVTKSARLYDANYYVMNSEFKVYVCIDNGSSGISTTGNASLDEPTFTDLEPSKAGVSGDGYIWKYLFSVSPSDVIKFDSTEYITLPNDWATTTNAQIAAVRDNGDATVNENQLKKIYIDERGEGYSQGTHTLNILGDGTGAKAILDVDALGRITSASVSSGGKNYSYGMVDLGPINKSKTTDAKLVPIIPPSRGHGYNIYDELGAERVLLYARFDDSTKDFPVDTTISQIGVVKNPTSAGSTSVFTDNQYSSLGAIKFSTTNGNLAIGDVLSQVVTGGTAKGYVFSYDTETKIVKYVQDRSLFLNTTSFDQTDFIGVSTSANVYSFEGNDPSVGTTEDVTSDGGFTGTVDTGFSGVSTNPTGSKVISLGVQFNFGVAESEINKGSGDIIYIDNRPAISRNSRQKEDVKIILEF